MREVQGVMSTGKNKGGRKPEAFAEDQQSSWILEDTPAGYAPRQQQIIECMGNGVLVFGPDGNIVRINTAIEHITGYPSADFLSGAVSWTGIIIESDRAGFLKQQKECMAAKKAVSFTCHIMNAAGQMRCIEETAAPLHDDTGVCCGVVSAICDITARHQEEAAVKRNAQINTAIAELSEALIVHQELEDVCRVLVRHAKALSNSPVCVVAQFHQETHKTNEDEIMTRLWNRMCSTPEPLILNELLTDPAFAGLTLEGVLLDRLIAVPVCIGDKVPALLIAANARNGYTEAGAQVLGKLTRLYALSLAQRGELETLRQSEALFRAEYRNIPVPTFTWQHRDGDFFLLDLNDAALIGMEEMAPVLIGKNAQDILPDHPEVLALLRQCHDSKEGVAKEMPVRHPFTKEALILAIRCAFVSPGLVLMHAENVTHRRRNEQALRRREAILEALAQTAALLISAAPWEQQAHQSLAYLGTATQASRVYIFENHFDSEGRLRVSQRFEWTAPGIAPEIDNPAMQNIDYDAGGVIRLRRILESGEVYVGNVAEFPPEEQAILAPQGICSILIVPIIAGKDWWGFIGFDECTDKREWSDAEIDALQATGAIMGAAIQRRRTELLIAEQRLKMIASARLSSLGVLAAGVAHEINNPLAVISLAAEQIRTLSQADPINADAVLSATEKMRRNVARIERITHGLRNLSRDNADAPVELAYLHKIIQEPIDLCRTRYQRDGIDMTVTKTTGDIIVECRPNQISQIIMNLLNNAYDAVMNQPVRWICIETDDAGDTVETRISDSGPCIQGELRERIFDPFFTTKDIGKGTGIGLSIAKAMAQGHRGDLYLDSDAPYTCFVLRLPKYQMQKDGI